MNYREQKRGSTLREETISGVQVSGGGDLHKGSFSRWRGVDGFESVLEKELSGLPARLDVG